VRAQRRKAKREDSWLVLSPSVLASRGLCTKTGNLPLYWSFGGEGKFEDTSCDCERQGLLFVEFMVDIISIRPRKLLCLALKQCFLNLCSNVQN
jgi:hypothetical protein